MKKELKLFLGVSSLIYDYSLFERKFLELRKSHLQFIFIIIKF